jgi:hypothetical protein
MLLTKTLGEDMDMKLEIKKVPIQRMVNLMTEKQADFGTPMLRLKDLNAIKNLPFDYSADVIQQMCFILYTNKSKPINIENLKNGNPDGYRIEPDISNMQMFNFRTLPSTNPEGSLSKVNDGLMDGYIMAGASIDPILKALKFKNLRRQHFETFDIVFALRKNDRGGPVDKFLSDGLRKFKASGRFGKIMGDTRKAGIYEEWQP